ncbi:MAG: uridine kinase [Spirochaetales bacterium]|nr:uridine kinase [Spirochaetales bacterium]
MDRVYLIGICGGSGSGKTTIVRQIENIVPDFVFVPQDNYYKSAKYINNQNITAFNFDHPDAFDNDLLFSHLSELKDGHGIQMPQYDFVHHCRADEIINVEPKKVIIFEGIMIFSDKRIRELIDLKLYVDTPADVRFIRRMKRDIEERGRTVDSVIKQYMEVVRPGHIEFIEPTKTFADLIIPEGGYNQMALEVLTSFIRTTLK